MKKLISLSLLGCTSLFAGAELDGIKAELEQQKLMTQKLESKVNLLEEKKGTNNSASFSQKGYLPDMALLLNMSTVGRNVKNSEYENYAVPGFVKSGDAELPFNKNRGFNLNYAELALHSVVDPYFEAFAYLHLHPNELEIDEGYVNTTALPFGLRIKAGKFKSAFGRVNEKHQHAWSFDEQALIYKSLFGPDAISDAGLQLQWVAPTDTYLMAGVEALQGTNDRSFGDSEKPNLGVAYLKSSVDVGDDLSILGGLSVAHGKTEALKDSDVYGADLTLRDQLGSYSSLVWQSEYLNRKKDQDNQAGFYSQLVYQYNNNYSAGVRYDKITKNDTDLSAYSANTDNLDKYTAMLEYKPFPMSRLRLEYSHDRSKIIGDKRQNIDTLMLTLNIAAGAHGAHSY
ncbi:Zinc-regulated TonB-dependent outer membrane receptor [hydrothermal vent metagenome]|uniref:Zinc-regulated TonB-dependent outer membrane receptor n=1 Tax=hydrothermal vent metagenome TaxID=652676 RepID=A0A1W1D0V5_9ZZZZ